MRFATLLLGAALSCVAGAAKTDESLQAVLHRPSVTHPSLYSFADLYRLTVSGASTSFTPLATAEAPLRTAVAPSQVQFSVSERAEPQLGPLVLSGIALAIWLARRRLGYPQ